MEIKTMNGLYVAYFWQNVTYEMLEDVLDYDIETISNYILQMGKYFYEQSAQKSILQPCIENKNYSFNIK